MQIGRRWPYIRTYLTMKRRRRHCWSECFTMATKEKLETLIYYIVQRRARQLWRRLHGKPISSRKTRMALFSSTYIVLLPGIGIYVIYSVCAIITLFYAPVYQNTEPAPTVTSLKRHLFLRFCWGAIQFNQHCKEIVSRHGISPAQRKAGTGVPRICSGGWKQEFLLTEWMQSGCEIVEVKLVMNGMKSIRLWGQGVHWMIFPVPRRERVYRNLLVVRNVKGHRMANRNWVTWL